MRAIMLIAVALLAQACTMFETPANVRGMHANEGIAHGATVGERDDLIQGYEDDLNSAFDFQGELGFRFRTLIGMVEDKVTKQKLEKALKDWAAFRARMKVGVLERREKRSKLSINDSLWSRAHGGTSRWINKKGMSQEQQDAIADQAGQVATDIATRQKDIAVEKEKRKAAAEKDARDAAKAAEAASKKHEGG